MLLADELVVEALKVLRDDCIALWASTGLNDTEARERAWMMLKAGDRFEGYLKAIVEDGQIKQAARRATAVFR